MACEIRRLCEVLVNVINERDFDYNGAEARKLRTQHISPDWHGRFDEYAWSITFDEQTEWWRQVTMDFPGVSFELVGIDCDVHKNDRTADVVIRSAMLRGDVKLLTACLLKWKFSNGRWLWYYHRGMKGIHDM